MDDLRSRLAELAERAAQSARAPGATVTLRRARGRRRLAAGGGAVMAVLVLVGLASLTARLVADREATSHPPRPSATVPATTLASPTSTPPEPRPLWTAKAAAPAPVTPPERGPEVAGDLVVVPTGFHEPGRVRAYEARTGKLRWVQETGPTAFVRAVGERDVIVAPQYGLLMALDLATGKQRWRFPLSPGQSSEHGTIAGDSLYVGTSFPAEGDVDAPIVYSLDLATGKQRWRAVLDRGADLEWGAPVVQGGLVLLADTPFDPGSAPTSHLYALDADTGQVRWKADLLSGQGFHTERPLVVDGLVYVATTSGALVALEVDSGREVWRQRRGPNLPLIVGARGSLVFTVLGGSLAALAADSGNPRWEVPIDAGERWAVLANQTIYVAAGAVVTAIDGATGAELWRSRTGRLTGPPTRVGERVYVATKGGLVALDATSGGLRWVSQREVATGPVAALGRVVIATPEGDLLAFAL